MINRFLKTIASRAFLIALSVIMLVSFVFLFSRSISTLNDYQSYLNDVDRVSELNGITIDRRRLMINPYDSSRIIATFQNQVVGDDCLETESANSAFFLNTETNSIQLERIGELIDHARELPRQTIDGKDYHVHLSPEELFGERLLYLGSADDALCEAMTTVRFTAGNDMDFRAYEQYARSLEDDNRFIAFINPVNEEIRAAARIVLDRFHPERTLYVNDSGWKTEAETIGAIESIVFATDIETIPTFDIDIKGDTGSERIRLLDLDIPSTVKRIESDAFPKEAFDIPTLRINSLDGLFMEYDALTGVDDILYDIPLFKHDETIDFSNDIDFAVDPLEGVSYTFDDMPPNIQQYGLNGYNAIEDGNTILIEFYANDFLIGFARNTYITNYYLEEDAAHPYHIGISSQGTFQDIEIPQKSGHTFNGWKLGDEPITEGEELPNKTIDVYADWVESP
ncbi:MAG: hypothetical protein ACLFSU_05645 [Acholeplasmataceae bacterium]